VSSPTLDRVQAAEVVLPCDDLDTTMSFFVKTLGFRVDEIMPADDPTEATISGHGVRLRLSEHDDGAPGVLRLSCLDSSTVADGRLELVAPNGTRVLLVDADPPVVLPPMDAAFVLTRAPAVHPGSEGRAGMLYRDLIPGRLGGRYIASHILVPDPGPVPDYVHYHRIHFQMIFCARGWVKLVYEDQGEPFLLRAGDCVLQPPEIRHRVLESSGAMEVVEISCPAEHITRADHTLPLPTPDLRPERDFSGQVFLHHRAAEATWSPWHLHGFEARDTGMTVATRGVARAHVVRVSDATAAASGQPWVNPDEFCFVFVLDGSMSLAHAGEPPVALGRADSFVVPQGSTATVAATGPAAGALELLVVTVPAAA
jgi:mannose-6-phosphate isomerase-like protein (cupin superfamily)/uncharacterized cupin superfamily protein